MASVGSLPDDPRCKPTNERSLRPHPYTPLIASMAMAAMA
jgi:hypothetical protein